MNKKQKALFIFTNNQSSIPYTIQEIDEILIGTETELFYQTKIDIGSEKNSGNYMKKKLSEEGDYND